MKWLVPRYSGGTTGQEYTQIDFQKSLFVNIRSPCYYLKIWNARTAPQFGISQMKEDEESERLWRAGRSIGPTRGIAGGSGDFCISLSSFLSSSISSSSSNTSSSPLVWNRVRLRNTRNMAKYRQHRLVECRNCWNRLAKSASRVWDFFPLWLNFWSCWNHHSLVDKLQLMKLHCSTQNALRLLYGAVAPKVYRYQSAILPFLEWGCTRHS